MNKCLNCGKDVKNKFCNYSCSNKFNNASKAKNTLRKRYGELKEINVICQKCKKEFIIKEYEKRVKEKYFCSRNCANSRVFSAESNLKRKLSNSLSSKKTWENPEYRLKRTKYKNIVKNCKLCNKKFIVKENSKKILCSKSCASTLNGRIGGKISAQKRVLRSKNEIYFF